MRNHPSGIRTNRPKPRGSYKVCWDPGYDHQVSYRATSLTDFCYRLNKQLAAGAVSIALTLEWPDSKSFDLFCRIVWSFLDGRRTTYLVVEEVASVQPSTGRAADWFGNLVREGRKFGLVILATSQRGAEIPKGLTTQMAHFYVGLHDPHDADRIAYLVGVDVNQVTTLAPGQFWHKEKGPKPAQLVKFKKL